MKETSEEDESEILNIRCIYESVWCELIIYFALITSFSSSLHSEKFSIKVNAKSWNYKPKGARVQQNLSKMSAQMICRKSF